MAFDFDKIKSGIISAGKEVGDAVTDASNTAKILEDSTTTITRMMKSRQSWAISHLSKRHMQR